MHWVEKKSWKLARQRESRESLGNGKYFNKRMKAWGHFFHHISILLNSFLFSFSMGKEGGDDSRMGNVGNAKTQKDEVLKQVEGNIYMDYLTEHEKQM